jgi:UDP-N-acetylglucosamine 2-epimerase (non-hydrolysing)
VLSIVVYDDNLKTVEEMNRQAISTISSLHFAPTLKATNALIQEGYHASKIFHTGNTAIDSILRVATTPMPVTADATLLWLLNEAEPLPFGEGRLKAPRMILLTTHRRENHNGGHGRIFQAALHLCDLFDDLHFVIPLHPNPNVQREASKYLPLNKRGACIHVVPPTSYSITVHLQKHSVIIMTDSGGLQEEASALQRPVLVLRQKSERMEGVKAGIAQVVGTHDIQKIVRFASKLLQNENEIYASMSKPKFPYGNGTAAQRIVEIVENRYLHVLDDGGVGGDAVEHRKVVGRSFVPPR